LIRGSFASLKDEKTMSAMFVLIGFSLIVALGFLIAFLWSVKKGQYDDDYTPSVRILFDTNKPLVAQERESDAQKNSK
jgi:cbb3-type cytochrome oxidase maturation protein